MQRLAKELFHLRQAEVQKAATDESGQQIKRAKNLNVKLSFEVRPPLGCGLGPPGRLELIVSSRG
jgi:hypothetical protein